MGNARRGTGEDPLLIADNPDHLPARDASLPDSRAADAFREIVRLINPNADLPHNLFPGGPRANKRIRQLVYGYAQFLGMKLRRRRVVVVHGAGLAYLSGWVNISVEPSIAVIIASARRGQPIMPIAMTEKDISRTCAYLGVDRATEIQALFSSNGFVVLRAHRDGKPCIVHHGSTRSGRAATTRHANGLELARSNLANILGELLPEVYAHHGDGSVTIIVEQEFKGTEVSIKLLNDQQIELLTATALQTLAKIYDHTRGSGRRFGVDFIDSELLRLLSVLPEYKDCLSPAIQYLKDWITERELESMPAHGDYATRNLLFEADYSRLAGIIDWEWFWNESVAGFDALTLLLQIRSERMNSNLFAAIAEFLRNPELAASETVRPLVDLYRLSASDLWHLSLLIWLRVLWIGCVITEPDSPQWLRDAVLTPAGAMREASHTMLKEKQLRHG